MPGDIRPTTTAGAMGPAADFRSDHRSLAPDMPLTRRGFVVTSLATGFAAAAMPVSAQTMIKTDSVGLDAKEVSIPVADGPPGGELQVDTGWVGELCAPDGTRRRFKAWIFTPGVSRYRFVFPCERETTASAIEACEAAWAFYGGVFHVLVPAARWWSDIGFT